MMDIALEDTPVSGCTCFKTCDHKSLRGKKEELYLVDVDGIRFLPLALPLLLVALGDSLGGLARLGSSFSRSLGWHDRSGLKICKKT